jgi:hypothetical protein
MNASIGAILGAIMALRFQRLAGRQAEHTAAKARLCTAADELGMTVCLSTQLHFL